MNIRYVHISLISPSISDIRYEKTPSIRSWYPMFRTFSATQIGTIEKKGILIQSKFKRKNTTAALARAAYRAAIWHIWKERNATIFHNKETDKILVFRALYEDVHSLLTFCRWPCPPNNSCSGQFLTPRDHHTCSSNPWANAWHVALSITFEGEFHSHSSSEQFKQLED